MAKDKIKYSKSIRWIMEISIWFLIFIIIAGVIIIIRSHYKSAFQTYQIFLPDVDGVIVGSPVNMMGYQIGYVTQVNIVDDEVFVKFTLNKRHFRIPKGSVVTVEFSGLGGSKSIEVYPPDVAIPNKDDYLLVQPPKRIHDSAGLMFDMFDKISDISYKFSYFAKKTTDVKVPDNIIKKDAKTILNDTDNWLDNATEKIKNMKKKKRDTAQKN